VLRNWSGSRIRKTHVSFLRAVQHLEVGTIDRLIDEGADIDGVRVRGLYAPLILAIRCRRVAVARLLLERGADPNRADSNSTPPLINACQHRACAMATLLLDFGADVNATDDRGRTPLLHASYDDELDLVTLLLDRGADILKGIYRTPLGYAVHAGKKNVTRLLLQRGAPVDCTLLAGVRALEYQKLLAKVRDPADCTVNLKALSDSKHYWKLPLFDAYLRRYWKLRVRLRVFGRISEHLLDLYVAPFVIGDGVLKKRSSD
jgi:hypothetical protein